MPLLNVKGHIPGTAVAVTIVVETEKVSFITPCPGCNLVQIHCSGSYFETDRIGTNLILNSMKDAVQKNRDIRMSAGYENVIEWPE
jgi:hypothetical protein